MSDRLVSESDESNGKTRAAALKAVSGRVLLLTRTKRAYVSGSLLALLIFTLPIIANNNQAFALIIPIDQAYSYETDWHMPSKGDVEGILQPRILITSYNNSVLSGSIVDESGDVLTFYGKESRVMMRWEYDSGFGSKWSMDTTPVNGSFSVLLPKGYEHADSCRIYINGNYYSIKSNMTGPKTYNYSDTTIWVDENYFKIKAPNANPDQDWYLYYGQIPVHVNSASLTYRLN